MARAIDADVFIRDLTAMKKMYDAIELDGMIKALKEAPTIDTVKHGKWTRSYETGSQDYDTMRNIRYRCSECNKKAMWDTEYCPHCGSRMDGE